MSRLEWVIVAALLGLGTFFLNSLGCPRASPQAARKEAWSNLLRIAGALERDARASGSFSVDGGPAGCPAVRGYAGHGEEIGDLELDVAGDYFAYTVITADLDEDGRCEWFQVSAHGEHRPVEGLVFEIDSRGNRTGMDARWRELGEGPDDGPRGRSPAPGHVEPRPDPRPDPRELASQRYA